MHIHSNQARNSKVITKRVVSRSNSRLNPVTYSTFLWFLHAVIRLNQISVWFSLRKNEAMEIFTLIAAERKLKNLKLKCDEFSSSGALLSLAVIPISSGTFSRAREISEKPYQNIWAKTNFPPISEAYSATTSFPVFFWCRIFFHKQKFKNNS